jgi:hypothetical protein
MDRFGFLLTKTNRLQISCVRCWHGMNRKQPFVTPCWHNPFVRLEKLIKTRWSVKNHYTLHHVMSRQRAVWLWISLTLEDSVLLLKQKVTKMPCHFVATQKYYVKRVHFHNKFLSLRADVLQLTAEQDSSSKCSLDAKCPAYCLFFPSVNSRKYCNSSM